MRRQVKRMLVVLSVGLLATFALGASPAHADWCLQNNPDGSWTWIDCTT